MCGDLSEIESRIMPRTNHNQFALLMQSKFQNFWEAIGIEIVEKRAAACREEINDRTRDASQVAWVVIAGFCMVLSFMDTVELILRDWRNIWMKICYL